MTGLSSNDFKEMLQQKDTNSFLYHSRNIPPIPACIVLLCVCVFEEMKAQNWLAAQWDRTQSRALGVCAVLTVSIHASSSEHVWKCALTRFRIVLCWVFALNRGSSQFLQKPVYSLSGLLSVQIGCKQILCVPSSSSGFHAWHWWISYINKPLYLQNSSTCSVCLC